jgi:hypothetical protein
MVNHLPNHTHSDVSHTDEAEVTAPLSLAEWFEAYYAHALAEYGPHARDPLNRGKMVQGVCRAGETMYMCVLLSTSGPF